MIIKSDWHVHSEFSYDAKISLETIGDNAKVQGLINVGITDHLNFNDEKFTTDLINSVNGVKKAQEKYPFMVLGVELTPIEKPEFDYILTHPDHEGYVAPIQEQPFDIELGMSKENLKKLGVRYAIGASHWRVDKPNGRYMPIELDASIKEWHRQQMWLANDERVTILGHPWYHGN
ncbi:MAG: PHP domain-containing protein, partial [Clostridia bacterium]|nr:PHP domain-containing protein [Clostridia bacterium]